jgi:hypothetical protein
MSFETTDLSIGGPRPSSLRQMAHITAALVEPWYDSDRAKILLAGSLGGFGLGLMDLALNYTIAGQGLSATLIFLAFRLGMAGLLAFPFFYQCLTVSWARHIYIGAQFLGLALLLKWPASAFGNAAGYILLSTPFWAVYHLRFAVQRSRHNHGRETALSGLLFTLTGSASALLAGWLLQTDEYVMALFVSSILLFLATQVLMVRLPAAGYTRQAWSLMGRRRPSTRLSVLTGVVNAAQDFSMPSWLRLIGLSPLATGALLALRPILSFLLTPLVGHLVHGSNRRAVQVGGLLILAGWLWLALSVGTIWALLPAFGLLVVGGNLIYTAEISRWYKTRSPAGIIARETAITFGRCPAFALTLPVIFLAPAAYPLAGIAVAILFICSTGLFRSKTS